jgi:hypothetical protein
MMPFISIRSLLEQKSIYILCPQQEDSVHLFKYLSNCNDIGWASKKLVTPLDTRWEAEKQNMVYELQLRTSLTRLTRLAVDHLTPIVMTFTHQDHPDVVRGHVFTVEAFISYLRSQGASTTYPYEVHTYSYND